MAIQYIGNTISGLAGDTKPTLTANEKGVVFVETDTDKLYQWDGDSWNITTATDATTSAKGVASFSSDNFAASSGAITIKDGGVILGTETTGNYVATVAGTSNEITVSGSTGAVTIGMPDDVTVGGDLVITGDLTVQGDTVTANTATLTIEDPLIYLANGQSSSPAYDSGFVVERGNTTNVAFIWDESLDEFAAANVPANEVGGTAGNVTIDSYANLKAANIAGTLTTASQTAITGVGTITTGVWNAGAVTSSGAITGASLVADATTINSNTISVSSANLTLDPDNDIILSPSGISQNYAISDRGHGLTLQSQTSGSDSRLEMFSKDGDATDGVFLYLYAKGTPSAVTNIERGLWYYDTTNTRFFFGTDASGSGTARDLRIAVPAGKDIILGDDAAILTVAGSGDALIGNGNGLVVGHTAKITTEEFQVLGTASSDSSSCDASASRA